MNNCSAAINRMPSRKMKHAPLAQLELELKYGLNLACHHMKEYVRSGADVKAYMGDSAEFTTEKEGMKSISARLICDLPNLFGLLSLEGVLSKGARPHQQRPLQLSA